MMKHLNAIVEVVQSGVSELMKHRARNDLEPECRAYATTLFYYLQGKIDELRCWSQSRELDAMPLVQDLTQARLAVRTHLHATDAIAALEQRIEAGLPDVWLGETHTVLAMYREVHGDEHEAKRHYELSSQAFIRAGAAGKAAKAYHNSIAAQSRIDPSLRLIPEYQLAAKLAKDAGDFMTAAVAIENLSREFQLMKAYRVARRYADEAVALLREHAYGTLDFYLSLCHRAHVLTELGLRAEALLDYEEASVASYPEVRGALEVIEDWLGQSRAPEADPAPIATWKERDQKGLSLVRSPMDELSELEHRLVDYLAQGPQDRVSIATHLWGEREGWDHLENRLKQLFHRVRKKRPDLLGYVHGKYFIKEMSAEAAQS